MPTKKNPLPTGDDLLDNQRVEGDWMSATINGWSMVRHIFSSPRRSLHKKDSNYLGNSRSELLPLRYSTFWEPMKQISHQSLHTGEHTMREKRRLPLSLLISKPFTVGVPQNPSGHCVSTPNKNLALLVPKIHFFPFHPQPEGGPISITLHSSVRVWGEGWYNREVIIY